MKRWYKLDNIAKCQNIIETTVKSFDIMGHQINQDEIEKADYKVDIESRDIGLLDISKIDYMVNLGYNVAKRYLKNIN